MVEISPVAQELSSIEKIIDSVLNIDSKVRNALWNRQARTILKRLRDLYFSEDGSLGLLRRVANGEPVTSDMLERVSARFYSYEEQVADALQELEAKSDLSDIRLSLDDRQMIVNIIHDKTLIREWIRDIYYELEKDRLSEWARDRAKEMCESIDSLNAKFCEADKRLRKHV